MKKNEVLVLKNENVSLSKKIWIPVVILLLVVFVVSAIVYFSKKSNVEVKKYDDVMKAFAANDVTAVYELLSERKSCDDEFLNTYYEKAYKVLSKRYVDEATRNWFLDNSNRFKNEVLKRCNSEKDAMNAAELIPVFILRNRSSWYSSNTAETCKYYIESFIRGENLTRNECILLCIALYSDYKSSDWTNDDAANKALSKVKELKDLYPAFRKQGDFSRYLSDVEWFCRWKIEKSFLENLFRQDIQMPDNIPEV